MSWNVPSIGRVVTPQGSNERNPMYPLFILSAVFIGVSVLGGIAAVLAQYLPDEPTDNQ